MNTLLEFLFEHVSAFVANFTFWRRSQMKKSLKKAKGKTNKKDSGELQKLSAEETKDVSGGIQSRPTTPPRTGKK